jgi:hypothetical protein
MQCVMNSPILIETEYNWGVGGSPQNCRKRIFLAILLYLGDVEARGSKSCQTNNSPPIPYNIRALSLTVNWCRLQAEISVNRMTCGAELCKS